MLVPANQEPDEDALIWHHPASAGTQIRQSGRGATGHGSDQALLFCLRYDFPTEWSAFVNGAGDLTAALQKQFFPYAVQGAKKLTVDGLTLYADSGGKLVPVSPAVDPGTLSASLSGATGEGPVSFPADGTVMVKEQSQQVFLLLQYHFGMS